MRLDLALKYLCLVKTRSSLRVLFDKQAIRVNDRAAKPASTLHEGDLVTLDFGRRRLVLRMLEVPERQKSKSAAPRMYEVVEDLEVVDY